MRARPGRAGQDQEVRKGETGDRDVAAAPGCVRNLGSKWNRVLGVGVRGRGGSLDLRKKARELRAGPGGLQRCREDDRYRGSRLPSSLVLPSHLTPMPSGLRYSSDLRHMRMTRSVDSVQFLPFLTTDFK